MTIVHVEMYDGNAFCGLHLNRQARRLAQQDWHDESEAIQRATCQQCLLRIFMLGDSASIALERMGLQVEVKDAPAEVVVS